MKKTKEYGMEEKKNIEMHELHLTEILEVSTLQRIQDAFSKMTGMAALTTDVNGIPVTKGSNFTDFCMKYTRNSRIGVEKCQGCDRFGAETTWKNGKATTYYCHAGLVDFAAPIMAGNKMIGCFIGGQVLPSKPNPKFFENVAKKLEIDPQEYLSSLEKVPIMDKENIDKSADFLCDIADVLSDIAYGKYIAYKASKEMEKAANLKSDFLANMSHEIRTPMNAVIGMAEMALREEIPPAARAYINQIKESGKTLLTIINDILDFSKIESGKMDINVVEYEVMSVMNDIVNIVMTRLKGKEDVELILNLAPDIPNLLLGDNIRLKQIIINLANNAIKFTQEGRVKIDIHYKKIAEDEIMLEGFVEDTGIGIKEEDMGRLFQSFQQVDSKRNRNIEGTGLGLAISKQLLSMMGGSIQVESEYGKGSRFSFSLPQKIVDSTPSLSVKNAENMVAAVMISNKHLRHQIKRDCQAFGVEYRKMKGEEELQELPMDKDCFVFIEESMFSLSLEEYIKMHQEITAVLMVDYFKTVEYNIPNLLVIKKPFYSLNLALIFQREDLYSHGNIREDEEFDFVAPDAEILVVDDNPINLTVVEGLLEPLKMKIEPVLSGKEAISKISVHRYDLIFMDHMMPELDGVETTHIIRRFHEEYNDIPIIALTANAVDGTREMFLREGMNDFVAKPIELRMLVSKIKQWLPVEKIKRVYHRPEEMAEKEKEEIIVGDLDTASAIRLLGSEKLFWTVLKDYYHAIEKKAMQIREYIKNGDWASYTIEVHSLKSTSKQIGAIELSEKAAALEKAGNARDKKTIRKNTEDMLQQYLSYISVFKEFFPEENRENDDEKEEAGIELLQSFFQEMSEAVENLDMDHMEEVIRHMKEYAYKDWQGELFEKLKEAVSEVDVDECEMIMQEWQGKLL